MATRDITLSFGASVTTETARPVVLSVGFGLASGRAPWAGSVASRRSNKWLPRADIPWFDPRTGRPTPAFAAFMVELAENRMGGVNGTTLPAIQTVSSLTQAQVLQTTQSVAETIAYARGVGETAAALAEVARDNALSGSGSVPAVPEPPPPPYYEPPV